MMAQPYQTLIIESHDTVAQVAFNRPQAANALNTQMALDLRDFFYGLRESSHPYRAILLTGNGKNFCAGADLKERRDMNEAQWQAQHTAFEEALEALMQCDLPVVAAINGAAFGGGLELALACDLLYAADNARFGLTETTLGIMPGMGGTQALPRAIGMARAKEVIFSGRPFSAKEAYAWGMLNAVHPAEVLLNEVIEFTKNISKNAPLALKAAKRAMNEGIALPLREALQCELTHYNTLLKTKDRHEGINAFNEKRKPLFSGH